MDERTPYRAFLVTNKHVVDGAITRVHFNHSDTGLTLAATHTVASGDWTLHPAGANLAVTPLLDSSPLRQGRELQGLGMFIEDVGTTIGEGIQPVEGDGVFVIGFPLGLVGEARNFPVVCYGVVSRIQDWIQRQECTFLIDASVFPGNSDGPVILKPELAAIADTKPNTHCLLVGVTSQQLRSREVAVSEQTGKPRIVFEEDAGLAEVIPVEFVRETVIKEMAEVQSCADRGQTKAASVLFLFECANALFITACGSVRLFRRIVAKTRPEPASLVCFRAPVGQRLRRPCRPVHVGLVQVAFLSTPHANGSACSRCAPAKVGSNHKSSLLK